MFDQETISLKKKNKNLVLHIIIVNARTLGVSDVKCVQTLGACKVNTFYDN